MSGLEPLRGLLQVVEGFIEDKKLGIDSPSCAAAGTSSDGELLEDLSSFLATASLEELVSLRHRICLGGLQSVDQLLKGVDL